MYGLVKHIWTWFDWLHLKYLNMKLRIIQNITKSAEYQSSPRDSHIHLSPVLGLLLWAATLPQEHTHASLQLTGTGLQCLELTGTDLQCLELTGTDLQCLELTVSVVAVHLKGTSSYTSINLALRYLYVDLNFRASFFIRTFILYNA